MDPVSSGIVSNLVAKVLEVLATEAIKKAKSLRGAHGELKKLKQTIGMIQARVGDAERYQEGERLDVVKQWLLDLKPVLYQADDLFDMVLTLDRGRGMLSKVRFCFSRSRKLVKEIKSIREQVAALKDDMDWLPSSNHPAQQLPITLLIKERETGSFVDAADVVGREDDAKKIIDMLFDPNYDDEEQITVIPIVGFGGVGKTTLAQLVFNHERVKQHFELRRWAYVPEKDNLTIIKGKIFQAFKHDNYQDKPLSDIEQGIIESIAEKKYLLVLDDMWNEEGADFTKLLRLLKQGKKGSKVIVTTRSDVVAKGIGTIEVPRKLGTLTDDQSRTLFKKVAFRGHKEKHPAELSTIGEEIIKMCGNVPLAIEVVGGSLCSNHTQSHWLQVKNDLSQAQLAAGNDKIMPVLKLSYDYLPPESKLCFAYCSLFPKGYEFEMDDLVHLWLAQGYVELDKGERHFSDLVARNLFQGSTVLRNRYRYKMHDLLHDLAQKVDGNDSMVYERSKQLHDRLVHVNLNGLESPPSLKNANRLRSLFNFKSNVTEDNFFSEFQSLRVLSMDHSNEYKKIPSSIGRLIHLRYLKLKSHAIEYLPGCITRLVNLQTLNLESCYSLKELPSDFAKLVNLRHLLLPSNLTDLPPGFGKLTSLQHLNRFIVGKGNGIDSLGAWNHRGKLHVKFRRWRKDAIEEVKRTNLKNNHQLTSLTLNLGFWEEECTPAAGEMNEMLRWLQLPPKLRNLEVWNYKGDERPVRWLDGLSQLVSIRISGCEKCKVVPKLSGLPLLKSLKLHQLDELEYIEDEDCFGTASATHNNRCFFPSLEFLGLLNCYKLKGWRRSASTDEGEGRQLVFPCLLKMTVEKCPMLMFMPLAPKMESLHVREINWKMVEASKVRSNDDNEEAAASSSSAPPSSSSSMSLKELEIVMVNDGLITLSISSSLCNLSVLNIWNCSELRNLRVESSNSIRKLHISKCSRVKDISEGLQHLCGLEELHIYDCEELVLEEEQQQREEEGWKTSSGGWQGLSSLRDLRLDRNPKVKTLPRGIGCITTLQQLRVINMENLTEIPEEIGNLSLLRLLRIWSCPKVKSLPPSILGLPKLEELHIRDMENLTELPAGEIGNDNGNLPLLRELWIEECPKMKTLPSSNSIQGLASLEALIIVGCPDLAKKNMPGGEDWHLIQHIPYLHISDGSQKYGRIDGKEY